MGNCKGDFPTYIGTSIKSSKKELEKLKKLSLPIFFYDDCTEDLKPNGIWCGEYTNKSYAKYSLKDIKEKDRNGKLPQR